MHASPVSIGITICMSNHVYLSAIAVCKRESLSSETPFMTPGSDSPFVIETPHTQDIKVRVTNEIVRVFRKSPHILSFPRKCSA